MAPDTGNVPKGKARQQLHDGCICDMMEFTGSWDKEAVMKSSEEAFAVLDLTTPAPRYMYCVMIIALLLCACVLNLNTVFSRY